MKDLSWILVLKLVITVVILLSDISYDLEILVAVSGALDIIFVLMIGFKVNKLVLLYVAITITCYNFVILVYMDILEYCFMASATIFYLIFTVDILIDVRKRNLTFSDILGVNNKGNYKVLNV